MLMRQTGARRARPGKLGRSMLRPYKGLRDTERFPQQHFRVMVHRTFAGFLL